MGLIKKYYSKFLKIQRREIERYTRAAVTLELTKQLASKNSIPLVNDKSGKEKILVSLTTHGKRTYSVYLALECIALQTMKPDKVVLWLSKENFSPETLPKTIKSLEKRGLEIKYCDDIGSYTKLIYALENYSDYLIITIDDDIIYPFDLFEQLYTCHLKYPKAVCCNVARKMIFNNRNKLKTYNEWPHVTTEEGPSFDLLPLGVNGILYFPGCFDSTVLDIKQFKSLAPKADDIWFKFMAYKNKTKSVVTGAYPNFVNSFIPLDSSQINALGNENVISRANDVQIKSILDYYHIDLDEVAHRM